MKTRLRFKRDKVKIKTPTSSREKKLRRTLVIIASLLMLNFGWDGYKRRAELSEYYGLTKQYYGIILDEAGNIANRFKKQTDTIETE